MRHRSISGRLLVGFGCLSLATAALAEECSRSDGVLKYCPCLYSEALDKIKESQGTTATKMKQRLEAAQKALERCFKKSDSELEEEISKVK